jgi:hypothetical protein
MKRQGRRTQILNAVSDTRGAAAPFEQLGFAQATQPPMPIDDGAIRSLLSDEVATSLGSARAAHRTQRLDEDCSSTEVEREDEPPEVRHPSLACRSEPRCIALAERGLALQ